MEIEKIFQAGMEQHHYANTAYPLDGRKVWKNFKVPKEKVDEVVKREWEDVDKLALYVHIPFCIKRCKYCEYAVLSGEEAEQKEEYVDALLEEIEMYKKITNGKTIVGFDLGGGTPTVASLSDIAGVVNTILPAYKLADGFGMSIETTPFEALDTKKLRGIRQLGIERISMGMQTINPKLLEQVGRVHNGVEMLKNARDSVRKAGFERFNIDLMYGFANQSLESLQTTVQFAIDLDPEQITLYRNRYKRTRLEKDAVEISLEEVNQHYETASGLLRDYGYHGRLGKNTFSRIPGDPGTSPYLTKRVVEGTPYLGMGLAAQGMALHSLYYNQGAASKRMNKYLQLVNERHFPVQDFYLLSPEEIMAKVMCVSFYFGGVDTEAFTRKFGISLESQFNEEVNFLLENDLMCYDGGFFGVTKKGKDVINGIIPLFYSERSKENLLRRKQNV